MDRPIKGIAGQDMSMAQQPNAATGANDIKIRMSELSKVFETRKGPFVAIDQLSLEIPQGCFFMIVGPSGCGKTTLLRILA